MIGWAALTHDTGSFLDKITGFLTHLEILDVAEGLYADHIGIKLSKAEDVECVRGGLESYGHIISSAQINGREIFIFQLDEPIIMLGWRISYVELPYPKLGGRTHSEGWDHVEFVIPSDAIDLDGFRAAFCECFPELDIEALAGQGIYSESMPQAETKQLPNPTIVLRSDNFGVTIKFHPKPINEIVGYKG